MQNVVELALLVFVNCLNWKKSNTWELQLCMPLKNKNELKQDSQSSGDRYKEVEDDILCNIKKHEPYLDIDNEELQNLFSQIRKRIM